MKKSLANRLYLKKLYIMHMEEGKDLRKHLDEFNGVFLDLNSIDLKIEEEDQDIILLSSPPKSYEHFVDTMLYVKQTLTMYEVKLPLILKDQASLQGEETRKRMRNLAKEDQDLSQEMVEDATSVTRKGTLEKIATKGRRRWLERY